MELSVGWAENYSNIIPEYDWGFFFISMASNYLIKNKNNIETEIIVKQNQGL